MTVVYTLRFRDLWRFNAIHQLRSPAFQVLYVGLAALFARYTAVGSKCSASGCMFVACLSFIFIYIAMMAFQFAFNAVFLFSRNNRNILTEHRVEIRSEGLYEETAYSRCLFLWPGITRIVTAAGFIAVYVTANSALLVPNRSFASPADREEFLRSIRANAKAV